MIGFLMRWFVPKAHFDHTVDRIYQNLDYKVSTIASLRHQIDQLSAAVIELRNANMARQEQDQQKQSRAKRTAAKKQPTKGKQ